MASNVVDAANALYFINNSSKYTDINLNTMILSANRDIFNDVFPKLRHLDAGSALKGDDARRWDALALSQEQNLVQPLYIKYQNTEAMKIYENAVRQKGMNSVGNYIFGLGPFTEKNLADPKDRWVYGMKQMKYDNVKKEDMP